MNFKSTFITIVLLTTVKFSFGQQLLFSKCSKISYISTTSSIDTTFNKGFLLTGSNNAENSPSITCTFGGFNVWVTKVDSSLNTLWVKCLGTPDSDYASKILQLSNGEILVSWDWGKPIYPGSNTIDNYAQLTKLDSNGNTIWSINFYTNSSPRTSIKDIIELADGNYIISGKRSNINGDFWMAKLDPSGNIIWQTQGGGNKSINKIIKTKDGGFISIGYDYHYPPNTIGKCENAKGKYDIFVYKTDTNGNLEWKNCYGGSNEDIGIDILQLPDESYIFLSRTNSRDYDIVNEKNNEYQYYDTWVVNISNSGNIIWSKCFGGSQDEYPARIFLNSNNNIIVCSSTRSIDGDLLNKRPSGGTYYDSIWIFEITQTGNITWNYLMGKYSKIEVYDDFQNRTGDFAFDKINKRLSFLIQTESGEIPNCVNTTYSAKQWFGSLKIPNCQSNLNIINPISSNLTLKSSNFIAAESKISSPYKVNFDASKSILLNPNFEVEAGSTFKAQITNGCGSF